MWLYLYSLLALGSVESLTIPYPYRTLLSYDSTRSLAKVPAPQGFLIYLDNNGVERVVSFNYAEPVYAIRRINFINSEEEVEHKFEKHDSIEMKEAREAHFRAWSLQQYQVLKREIDFLQGEGKEPSIEMALQFLPLEKIALTADYSTIAELPEIKRIREEHLNIWKQILQAEEEQNRSGGKNSIEKSKPSTSEMEVKKNTHVDDIGELKQLSTPQTPDGTVGIKDEVDVSRDSNAFKNIKPEEKLANEIHNGSEIAPTQDDIHKSLSVNQAPEVEAEVSAASTINKENSKDIKQEVEADVKHIQNLEVQGANINTTDAVKTKETKQEENLEINSGTELKQDDYTAQQKQSPILVETLDIRKGQDEESDAELEAKKQMHTPQKLHSDIQKLISAAPAIYVPQQVVDTAEVMRARNEHLKIVNEAIQKAKLAQLQEKQRKAAVKLPEIASNGTKVESVAAMPKTGNHHV